MALASFGAGETNEFIAGLIGSKGKLRISRPWAETLLRIAAISKFNRN